MNLIFFLADKKLCIITATKAEEFCTTQNSKNRQAPRYSMPGSEPVAVRGNLREYQVKQQKVGDSNPFVGKEIPYPWNFL
jgi:hypothetical protein